MHKIIWTISLAMIASTDSWAWTNTSSYVGAGEFSLKFVIAAPHDPTIKKVKFPVLIFEPGDGTADLMVNDVFDPLVIAPQMDLASRQSGFIWAMSELRREYFHGQLGKICSLDFYHRSVDLSRFVDIIKQLDYVDTSKIFLAGHSAGAETVTRLANERGDIRGVINLAGGVRSCSEGATCPSQNLTSYDCGRNGDEGRTGLWWQQLFWGSFLFREISGASVPYLALIGDQDTDDSVQDFRTYAPLIASSKGNFSFQVIPGVGHGSIITSPIAIGSMIRFVNQNL